MSRGGSVHICVSLGVSLLFVSWYFERSQPQRITSRPKTMFSLSAIYSERKSANHKLSRNHKISPDTNAHEKNKQKNTSIKHEILNLKN